MSTVLRENLGNCAILTLNRPNVLNAINEGANMPLKQALAHEFEEVEALSKSEDCIEGVMSFIEKREPIWKDS